MAASERLQHSWAPAGSVIGFIELVAENARVYGALKQGKLLPAVPFEGIPTNALSGLTRIYPTASHTTLRTPPNPPSQPPLQQEVLGALRKQIMQLHEKTLTLQQRHLGKSQRLVSLTSAQCNCLAIPPFSPEPTPFDANCLPLYDLTPCVSEEQSVWNTQQEFLDLFDRRFEENEVKFDCAVSQDARQFNKSLFMPFAIKDATMVPTCLLRIRRSPTVQPFYVWKLFVHNWDAFLNFPHKPGICDCKPTQGVTDVVILTANRSFCFFSQYTEVVFTFLHP